MLTGNPPVGRCWGYDNVGQSTVPDNLGNVAEIVTGTNCTCSLDDVGEMRCWGDNSLSQVNVWQ